MLWTEKRRPWVFGAKPFPEEALRAIGGDIIGFLFLILGEKKLIFEIGITRGLWGLEAWYETIGF